MHVVTSTRRKSLARFFTAVSAAVGHAAALLHLGVGAREASAAGLRKELERSLGQLLFALDGLSKEGLLDQERVSQAYLLAKHDTDDFHQATALELGISRARAKSRNFVYYTMRPTGIGPALFDAHEPRWRLAHDIKAEGLYVRRNEDSPAYSLCDIISPSAATPKDWECDSFYGPLPFSPNVTRCVDCGRPIFDSHPGFCAGCSDD